MKKKILFIVPPYASFDDYFPKDATTKKSILTAPYGVLSLASYINKKNEYDIQIADINLFIYKSEQFPDLSNEERELLICQNLDEHFLVEFKPDFVCISALFNTCFPYLPILVQTVKKRLPDTFVTVGGGLGTNLYQELIDEINEIDAICYGEGEIPLKKLLETDHLKDISALSPAWITKQSLEKQIGPQHDFIQDLDEIPIINYDLIDISYYNGRSYIDKNPEVSKKVELSIHTSRGCPFSCVFCSNGKIHGKKIRYMSTQMVIDTIQYYVEEFGVTTLLIEDDHFLSKKERAIEVIQAIKQFNLNVEFPNGVAVYKIDDDIARFFWESGVVMVPLAIESGCDYVLKEIMHKPLKKTQIYKAVNALKKYDIRVHVFVIIGLPFEYDEHRKETLKTLLELSIDWAHIFIATPIAGSKLYEDCTENGYLINTDYNKFIVTRCNIKAPGVDPKQIEEYAYYMNIVVNFIRNYNFISKNYNVCRDYFKNVIRNYPQHLAARFMMSKIENANGNSIEIMIKKSPLWNAIFLKLEQDGYINVINKEAAIYYEISNTY